MARTYVFWVVVIGIGGKNVIKGSTEVGCMI